MVEKIVKNKHQQVLVVDQIVKKKHQQFPEVVQIAMRVALQSHLQDQVKTPMKNQVPRQHKVVIPTLRNQTIIKTVTKEMIKTMTQKAIKRVTHKEIQTKIQVDKTQMEVKTQMTKDNQINNKIKKTKELNHQITPRKLGPAMTPNSFWFQVNLTSSQPIIIKIN